MSYLANPQTTAAYLKKALRRHCDVITYGVSADEARRFGLPCGGTVQLVTEPLGRASGIRTLLAEIEAGHLARGGSILRAVPRA